MTISSDVSYVPLNIGRENENDYNDGKSCDEDYYE